MEQSLPSPHRLAWQIGVATLARLLLNTSRRFVYPFIPALSRGLGAPLTDITALIAVNQAAGLFSALFLGPLSDRWGCRTMMLAALGSLAVGMLAGGSWPFYGVVVVAMALAGLGKSMFDPALQAFVGERVPYHRRGLVIGLTELAWAGSSLVGIPLMGLLIDRLGWRSPFLVLGGLALLSLVTLRVFMPPDRRRQHSAVTPGVWSAWQQLWRDPAALGAIGFSFLVNIANDNLFVVYGVWLEQRFGLSLVAVGLATTVIGLAELCGEMLTASIADRLGLKRTITIALSLSTLSYLALPLVSHTLPLALVSLFIIFLTFELTVVTSISLFTEILPGARATMMSAYLAAAGLGRVVGALGGGAIWLSGGLPATGAASAVMSGLGLICLWWGWRAWRR